MDTNTNTNNTNSTVNPLAFPTLGLPAYPNLEKALGYNPELDSEFVSFYYIASSSVVDDGRDSRSGNDWNYIAFEKLCREHADLNHADFGSDDGPYHTHRFLLHRPSRNLYALEAREARQILKGQWQGKGANSFGFAYEVLVEAFASKPFRPFNFMGAGQNVDAMRGEMLDWYKSYFENVAASNKAAFLSIYAGLAKQYGNDTIASDREAERLLALANSSKLAGDSKTAVVGLFLSAHLCLLYSRFGQNEAEQAWAASLISMALLPVAQDLLADMASKKVTTDNNMSNSDATSVPTHENHQSCLPPDKLGNTIVDAGSNQQSAT